MITIDQTTRAQLAIICMEERAREAEHEMNDAGARPMDDPNTNWLRIYDRASRALDRRQKALTRLSARYQTLTA